MRSFGQTAGISIERYPKDKQGTQIQGLGTVIADLDKGGREDFSNLRNQ